MCGPNDFCKLHHAEYKKDVSETAMIKQRCTMRFVQRCFYIRLVWSCLNRPFKDTISICIKTLAVHFSFSYNMPGFQCG